LPSAAALPRAAFPRAASCDGFTGLPDPCAAPGVAERAGGVKACGPAETKAAPPAATRAASTAAAATLAASARSHSRLAAAATAAEFLAASSASRLACY
jgi:hypothetical protein